MKKIEAATHLFPTSFPSFLDSVRCYIWNLHHTGMIPLTRICAPVTNDGIMLLPTKQDGASCTCLLPPYPDHLQSKPVTWVPVGPVRLLRWICTLQETCLFSYKNSKGCQTSFQNTQFLRKELRVEYAQSNTTIITSIINIIGINNYMFRPYMWAIIRL